MKYRWFYILITAFILTGCESTISVDGVLVAYYKATLSNIPGIENSYCLDSIRIKTNETIYAVLGDFVQGENFLYEPDESISTVTYTSILRQEELYCKNPLENHIHEGGETYGIKYLPNSLVISFNISSKAKRVIPKKNSVRNDSLEIRLRNSYNNFHKREGYYPCNYTINDSEYIILTEILFTKELGVDQIDNFDLKRSNVREFWRHGLW